MGKRSTARRLAMQILFQIELGNPSSVDEIMEITKENETFLPETVEFTKVLVEGVLAKKDELNQLIKEKSIGWSLDRITNVDKSILRLAIYEIKELQSPASVAINEAVNLAKKFSTAESSKFINGILGNIVGNNKLTE